MGCPSDEQLLFGEDKLLSCFDFFFFFVSFRFLVSFFFLFFLLLDKLCAGSSSDLDRFFLQVALHVDGSTYDDEEEADDPPSRSISK